MTIECPIIFSAPMVRAILDGQKMQTRRIIKPQPKLSKDGFRWCWKNHEIGTDNPIRWILLPKCPYGKPEDRLWVRESFCINNGQDGTSGLVYKEGYHARFIPKWKPSIHMPRWASRITLEITNVRVERVQDIYEADAFEEGINTESDEYMRLERDQNGGAVGSPAIQMFRGTWDFRYAKRGYGWDKNPWVWVIEFKRIQP